MENMNIREKQKLEAISRMKYLKLLPAAIRQFECENIVNYSEHFFLYFLEDDIRKLVQEFEEKHGALVYHVIKGTYFFGMDKVTIYDLLYVSSEESEWEMDRDNLQDGLTMVYSFNQTWDIREFGSICWASAVGGLQRVV